MDEKIILKPTDYVFYKDGKVDYSYPYDEQYEDGKYLDTLNEDELINEERRRWKEVQEFPVPSKISRYALARDLALAKGFEPREANRQQVHDNAFQNSEREF